MVIELSIREEKKKPDFYRHLSLVPGVLYGPNRQNVLIYADISNLTKAAARSSGQLINFNLEKQQLEGLLQETQLDPISGRVIHFDVYLPALDRSITTTVPLTFSGEEELEKQGFMINKNLAELEIEALPKNIPAQIEVSLESLKQAHQSLYVKDLNIPSGVKTIIPEETPVVTLLTTDEAA